MDLRPYQHRALADVRAAWTAGARRILLVMPTGSGKTQSAVAVVVASVAKGRRILWLAHRRELIDQASTTLTRLGVPHGVLLAGRATSPAPVQVASVQTLVARGDRPPADLVVHDEAQHDTAATFRAVAEAYPDATHLGLTATPERGDGTGLGNVYQALVAPVTITELVAGGYLVPCDVLAPARKGAHLAGDPVAVWQAHAEGRQTIAFCATVAQAHALSAAFVAAGVPAACVEGETATDLRADVLARYAAGHLRVVTNVYVLTEGYDAPATAVCLLTRGCGSASTYLQMVGRALRPSPGKRRALLLDLRGCVWDHGLPDADRTYHLDGAPLRDAAATRLALRQCAACGAVAAPAPACARCAYVFPPPAAPTVRAAPLARVTHVATPDARARELARLRLIAGTQGYKPGWVAHRYRAKFGTWPSGP